MFSRAVYNTLNANREQGPGQRLYVLDVMVCHTGILLEAGTMMTWIDGAVEQTYKEHDWA